MHPPKMYQNEIGGQRTHVPGPNWHHAISVCVHNDMSRVFMCYGHFSGVPVIGPGAEMSSCDEMYCLFSGVPRVASSLSLPDDHSPWTTRYSTKIIVKKRRNSDDFGLRSHVIQNIF